MTAPIIDLIAAGLLTVFGVSVRLNGHGLPFLALIVVHRIACPLTAVLLTAQALIGLGVLP